jgi:hypothetical protein
MSEIFGLGRVPIPRRFSQNFPAKFSLSNNHTMSLKSVKQHVLYHEEHQLLICKSHEYGITNITRHFQEQHKTTMTSHTRLQIFNATRNLPLVKPQNVDTSSIVHSIEGLKVISDGAKCNECKYLSDTIESMKKHCKVHEWNAASEDMWTLQAVQTFYPDKLSANNADNRNIY